MLILYQLTDRERECLKAVEYANDKLKAALEISKESFEASTEYNSLLAGGLIKDEAWAIHPNPQFTITETGRNALKQNPF